MILWLKIFQILLISWIYLIYLPLSHKFRQTNGNKFWNHFNKLLNVQIAKVYKIKRGFDLKSGSTWCYISKFLPCFLDRMTELWIKMKWIMEFLLHYTINIARIWSNDINSIAWFPYISCIGAFITMIIVIFVLT